MTRQGAFVWVIRIGFFIMTLGTGLFIYVDREIFTLSQAFIYLVSGFALGFLLPSLETASQAMAQPGQLTHATSTYIFMRPFGLCIGVALGGTVFSNVFLHALEDRGVADAATIAANSEAYANYLKSMPKSSEESDILSAYVEGFHGAFYFLVALSAVSLVLSMFIRDHTMNQKLQSGHQVQKDDKFQVDNGIVSV
ncbi:unnamed protein product [Discula destructiva]